MPIAPIQIRRASVDDAPLLAELGARTFHDAFGADNDPADMAQYVAAAFNVETIAAELRDPAATFVLAYTHAPDGERAIGYAKLHAGVPHAAVSADRPLRLSRLYVDAAAIGSGHGSTLMRACLDEATRGGFETLWLGVWEHNARALAFYERWGFSVVGSQAFVLGDDVQTDLVMARPVTRSE